MNNKQIIVNEIYNFHQKNNYDINNSSIIIPVLNYIGNLSNKNKLNINYINLNELENKIKSHLEYFLINQVMQAVNNNKDDIIVLYVDVLDFLASCFYFTPLKKDISINQVLTLT